jgi:hypothetical protein
MNKDIQHSQQGRFRSRNVRNKSAMNSTEDAFERAREAALLMLAQLSLSKTVAQIKKQ